MDKIGKWNPDHGYALEGHFVALKLAMPNETAPIPPDESCISALCSSDDGNGVFGATEGSACHIFASIRKSVCSFLFDYGIVPDAIRIPALCGVSLEEGRKVIAVAVEEDDGISFHSVQDICPFDTIQEPSFPLKGTRHICKVGGTRKILALAPLSRGRIICITDRDILLVDVGSGECHPVSSFTETRPRRAICGDANSPLLWIDSLGMLSRYDPDSGTISSFGKSPCDDPEVLCRFGGGLYMASDSGKIARFDIRSGESEILGRVPLSPVQCISALPDGRIYGVCGKDIGRFFRFDPKSREIKDLGVIASPIGETRYGFVFSSALTTREGAIYLGEYDRGGHLWIFFPPLQSE